VAAGLDTRPARIEHQGRQAGLQLDLTPAGSRALFGVPAAALAACAVHLEEVLGPAATELAERLTAAGGWPARLQVLDDVLLTVLGRRGAAVRSAQDTPPEVDLAWRRIVASGGAVPVEQLAREVGWSRRHLSERMRRETGLPPKALARLVRFEGVRRELALPVRPPLAQLALKCGYADQAHMTREFTDLAGCSPLRWLAEEELPLLQDGPHANPAGSGHDQ
jgi:AraC-like DNA-binding protein